MAKRYKVTAEYVTVTTSDPMSGQRVLLGFYRGALLPEDLTEEAIQHHLSTGQIVEVAVDNDGGLTEPDEAEDLRQTDPQEANVTDGLGDPNLIPVHEIVEPKRSDDKEAWIRYAVSKGADEADIRDKNPTKADLIAVWGTPR